MCSPENTRFCLASKCFNSDCQQEISVSTLLNLQLDSILFYYKPLTGLQNSGILADVHDTWIMNSTKLKSSLNKMSEVQLLIIFGIQRVGYKKEHEEWHRAAMAEDERWFALNRIYNCILTTRSVKTIGAYLRIGLGLWVWLHQDLRVNLVLPKPKARG